MNPTGHLARVFRQTGFDLYLVGSPVRDRILGRPSQELHFTTRARPNRIKQLVRQAGAKDIGEVDDRIGTVSAVFNGETVEISTFRAESYRLGSCEPRVRFVDLLEADLRCRDFTINAVAQDALTGRVIDPYNGIADLVTRRIRVVGIGDDRFREDPLRILRCARLAAQFGFEVESGTLSAARRMVTELARVGNERIGAELHLILISPRPVGALVTLLEIGVLGLVMPELIPLQHTEQEERRQHKDVFAHTMRVLSATPSQAETRWAALLHDIGKPETKSVRRARVRFHGHEEAGARSAARIMRRLKLDDRLRDRVTDIVRLHMRVNSYQSDWTDRALRQFVIDAGENLDALIALSRADITSYQLKRVEAALARVAELQARCELLQAEGDVAAWAYQSAGWTLPLRSGSGPDVLDSPLDGHALMELFDRPPGAWVGIVKRHLLDLVLDGELEPDDVERARTLAQEYFQRLESPLDDQALMELFGLPSGPWIKPIKRYLLDSMLNGRLKPDDVEHARMLAQEFVQRHAAAADTLQSEASCASR